MENEELQKRYDYLLEVLKTVKSMTLGLNYCNVCNCKLCKASQKQTIEIIDETLEDYE